MPTRRRRSSICFSKVCDEGEISRVLNSEAGSVIDWLNSTFDEPSFEVPSERSYTSPADQGAPLCVKAYTLSETAQKPQSRCRVVQDARSHGYSVYFRRFVFKEQPITAPPTRGLCQVALSTAPMISGPSVTVSYIPQAHILYNTAINPQSLLGLPTGSLGLPIERRHTDNVTEPERDYALIPSFLSEDRPLVHQVWSQEDRIRNICEAQRMARNVHCDWDNNASFSEFNPLHSAPITPGKKKEPIYSLSAVAQQRARVSHYLNSTPVDSASRRAHSVPTSFLCMSVLTIPERPMPTPVTPAPHIRELSASRRRVKGLYCTQKYNVQADSDMFTDMDAPEVLDGRRAKLTTSRSTSFDISSNMLPVSAPSQRSGPSGLSQRVGTRSCLSAGMSMSMSTTPSHEAHSSSTVVEVTFSTVGESLEILPPPRLSTRHVTSLKGSRPLYRR